ncbi:MAG TPA: hypothetical protein VF133_21770 [Terriglobales bacterium]
MKLVADANVLLSAVLGGRARLVFGHTNVTEIFTAEATLAEVEGYVYLLPRTRALAQDLLLPALAALPVTYWADGGVSK